MTPMTLLKRGAIPALALLLGLSSAAQAQSVVNTANFFSPVGAAVTDGPGGFLSVTVDTTTQANTGPLIGATTTWNHHATGLIEAGVALVGEVTLSTTTTTTGSSLVFGRSAELTGLLGILNGTVQSALGTSVLSNWASEATVGGLSLGSGNAYRVTFDITEGAGLPVGLLNNANLALYGNGSLIADANSNTVLNLLNLISLGGSTSQFQLDFIAPTTLTSLEFRFDASATASVNALGGVNGNQNVLTFSNLAVTPVPEPGSLTLLGLGLYLLVRRRSRR